MADPITGLTEAMSAQGAYFATGDGASPEVFTEFQEAKVIGGPNETADELEATHLRSPSGYREFLQSFKDGGEITIEANFIPGDATQVAMDADFTSGTTKNRRIYYPDGSYNSFAGWVKGRGNTNTGVNQILTRTYTVRVSGPVTLTEAA